MIRNKNWSSPCHGPSSINLNWKNEEAILEKSLDNHSKSTAINKEFPPIKKKWLFFVNYF